MSIDISEFLIYGFPCTFWNCSHLTSLNIKFPNFIFNFFSNTVLVSFNFFSNTILCVLQYPFKSELVLQTDATLQKCPSPPTVHSKDPSLLSLLLKMAWLHCGGYRDDILGTDLRLNVFCNCSRMSNINMYITYKLAQCWQKKQRCVCRFSEISVAIPGVYHKYKSDFKSTILKMSHTDENRG